MAFTHLHVHTSYSLLDGAARIDELVAKAVSMGMDSLAITDHGAMYGVVDFYQACTKAGINPLIGMEAYVAPSMDDRTGMRDYSHLVLIAKNQKGYSNLIQLSSLAFTDGFYYKPRIDYDLLEKYREGIICLSACLAGDIPTYLLTGQVSAAYDLAKRLKADFGEDFYIEIQDHRLPEQEQILPLLVKLAADLDIKTVATNDVHYVNRDDAEAQDILLCIQTNKYVDDEMRMRMSTDEFYLKSPEEMAAVFEKYPEAIANTAEVAAKCHVEMDFDTRHMPGYISPDGMDNEEYLHNLCMEGLARRYGTPTKEQLDRLEYEFSVIRNMGFIDYFLIVWDYINYARSQNIMVGPGRGSCVGSVLAYSLGITDLDPLKYDLLFERFLNPERVTMPDIDVDFCYERRQEVIDYVERKYGHDHVCQIITFGTMAARQVIKDVGRALHLPYGDVDRMAKMVPNEIGMTLSKALTMSAELRTLTETNADAQKVMRLSLRLEGLPRHSSTHAAGVVMSNAPVADFVPLQRNDEAITTQFPMATIEKLGMLKMDFLGLRTLTVIRDALDFLKGQGIDPPDFDHMDYSDPLVYEMIGNAQTDGVFQLESTGMRAFLMQLRPKCFEDVIAGISLFRPGPMEQIPRYISGKNDPEHAEYLHESLRPILSTTYGCMVYQEQVMRIVRDLGGYSMGRSDLVRRAMSKKKAEVLQKERANFIDGIVDENGVVTVPGAVRNGVPAAVANRIFDEMMAFAGYAFNKSHAAAYAVVAYRTAYLKLYHPVEFMAALLNSFLGNAAKVAEYIYSCKRSGIEILPPDINKSFARFTVDEGRIRFGLAGIRNVGEAAVRDMIAEREAKGPYSDFFDICRRSDSLNKRMAEGLIKAGCFDFTGAKRSQLLASYETILDSAMADRKQRQTGQLSLFDMLATEERSSIRVPLPDIPELPMAERLSLEKDALGIYISGHPLEEYDEELRRIGVTISEILEADGSTGPEDNSTVRFGGVVTAVKEKPTKNNSGMMAYVAIEDLTGSIEVAVFASNYAKYKPLFSIDAKVIVSGRLNIRDESNNTVVVNEVESLERDKRNYRLYLRLEDASETVRRRISEILRRFPGNVPVILYYPETGRKTIAPRELYVSASEAMMEVLKELLGIDNVKLVMKKLQETNNEANAAG